ncbi:22421_t:CDS:1, partial [Racocetra persica]
ACTKRYNMHYEVEEFLSEKLSCTIHNIDLSQHDTHEIEKDEFFVPRPIISGNSIPIDIDSDTYEF